MGEDGGDEDADVDADVAGVGEQGRGFAGLGPDALARARLRRVILCQRKGFTASVEAGGGELTTSISLIRGILARFAAYHATHRKVVFLARLGSLSRMYWSTWDFGSMCGTKCLPPDGVLVLGSVLQM